MVSEKSNVVRNVEFLEERAGDLAGVFVDTYAAAVQISESAKHVVIEPADEGSLAYYIHKGLGSDTNRVGIYLDSVEPFERQLGNEHVMDVIGNFFDFGKARSKVFALASFVLGHELGHANDDYGKGYFRVIGNLVFEMRALPIPNFAPSDLETLLGGTVSKNIWQALNKRYGLYTKGIFTPEELITAQRIAYVNMPAERKANEFAGGLLQSMSSDGIIL